MTKGQKITVAILVGAPLFCGMGGFLLFEMAFQGNARMLNRELRLARKEGVATTPDELVRANVIPKDQDAYPVLRKLLDLAGQGGPMHRDVQAVADAVGVRTTPKLIAAGQEAYPRIGEVLKLAREAGAFPHVAIPRNWSLGPAMTFGDFASVKSIAKAVLYDAQRRDEAGDWRGALTDVAAAQRLGRQCGDTPIMIGMLVQVAIEAMSQRVLDQLIDKHSHGTEFLRVASAVHAGFGPLANFRHALTGELVLGRIGLANSKSFRELSGSSEPGDSTKPNPIEAAILGTPTVRDAFEAKMLHYYRELLRDVPADPAQWEAAQRTSVRVGAEIDADHSLANAINREAFPIFSQAAETIGIEIAHRRLTDTALQILTDRARTGKLPAYLSGKGASHIDPFTGDPLIYRREGAGFLLYSVGRDRVDNGGVDKSSGATTGTDEVLRVHG